MPKARVKKVFNFEASHQLPNHKGKCGRRHGHSYKIGVTVEGIINDNYHSSSRGMVVDFYDLKRVWEFIEDSVLDHHDLNGTIPLEFQPTTAENIGRYIFNHFKINDINVVQVDVWETATGCATVYSEVI